MYLMNDKITATLGNIVMRSSRTSKKNEFILDPTAITGWTDGTTARRAASERPVSNGDFPEKATMGSRVITLSGTAIAVNGFELQKMRDDFIGVMADGLYKDIAIETAAGTRYASVGLEGTPSWVQKLDNVALWRIDLYSPDAYVYGPNRTITVGSSAEIGGGLTYILTYPQNFGSKTIQVVSATLTNEGNVPAWPKILVTGDYFSGFSITDNQDHKVTYTGTVTMQAPVEIDMAKGRAQQGGIDKSVYLTSRKWWSIQPGDTVRPSFTPIQVGTGWCDIMFRDTWI